MPTRESAPIRLLSRKEVALRWGVCTTTVKRRKDLVPVKLSSRMLRYRLEDVEAVEQAAGNNGGQR